MRAKSKEKERLRDFVLATPFAHALTPYRRYQQGKENHAAHTNSGDRPHASGIDKRQKIVPLINEQQGTRES